MSEIISADTQYRGGLIVPDFEVGMRALPAYNLRRFFDDTFAANGEGWPDFIEKKNPTAYTNEIVVPAAADKPLVVIRDDFSPKGEKVLRDSYHGIATYATLEKSILLAPTEESLTWRGLIRYKEYLEETDDGTVNHQRDLGPVITLNDNNKVNRKVSTKYDSAERTEVWNTAIKKALDQFVELVSN